MRQIHLNQCYSTQDALKEQLMCADSETILVSCNDQIAGRGRGENKWFSLPGSLCFSLNLSPHPTISFTAIEISVIVADFFEEKGISLKLKWPNDLWTKDRKKCGGILIQGYQQKFIAGIGLNLFSSEESYGGIFDLSFLVDKKKWAHDLALFIQQNRIDDIQMLKGKWHKRCGHFQESVVITEGDEKTEGIFQGLGDYGEALIMNSQKIHKIYNGSLMTPGSGSIIHDFMTNL